MTFDLNIKEHLQREGKTAHPNFQDDSVDHLMEA